MRDYLVTSQIASQIVLIEQSNFPFYPIKIRLEITEICAKAAKQLATAILGDQLVASQIARQIELVEQTKFAFYPIKIKLGMGETWQKVTKQLAMAILGDQLLVRGNDKTPPVHLKTLSKLRLTFLPAIIFLTNLFLTKC